MDAASQQGVADWLGLAARLGAEKVRDDSDVVALEQPLGEGPV